MAQISNEVVINKIEKIVEPVLKEMELSLVDVEYMQDGGYWYVRIFAENLEGDITLEDCAKISHRVEDDIDNLIDKKFFLEVSSPGIERPLKKIADFIRFKDEKAKLMLKHKVMDNKNFIGLIRDCKDDTIYLELEDKTVLEVPFKEIRKAHLVYEFSEF